MKVTRADRKLYRQKRKWYNRNNSWRGRRALVRELAARQAYAALPVNGNVLDGLRTGRLTVGPGTHFETDVWITIDMDHARIEIGEGCFLNQGVMIAACELITIGPHTMIGNGAFVGDSAHRYDNPDLPITWQGFEVKGPVHIGANCWIGVNSVITGGVTIGDRCVIGANSVVTKDVPAGTIVAGVPARTVRTVEFK